MPLLTERDAVTAVFDEARRRGWAIPAFGTENLTTTEAVLAAALEHGQAIGCPDLPVIIAATNQYPARAQACLYTHSRDWRLGLRLFRETVRALAADDSPYGRLRILLHLDHVMHDLDRELLGSNLGAYSSVMFDASTLPFEDNIRATQAFVRQQQHAIVIEGACDQIGRGAEFSDGAAAERFCAATGVDLVVANLGTEHRADTPALRYDGDRAREIRRRIGPRLVLHGTSSVAPTTLGTLAADGVCKANLWTALERDSAGRLLAAMVQHAAKIAGPAAVRSLQTQGLLGPAADVTSRADLGYYPEAWRRDVTHDAMKRIAREYLTALMPGGGA